MLISYPKRIIAIPKGMPMMVIISNSEEMKYSTAMPNPPKMSQMMFPNIFINIVLLINVFVSHNKTDRQSHDGKPALLEENLWITAPSTVEGHKNDIT